jgi:hypothetical protein
MNNGSGVGLVRDGVQLILYVSVRTAHRTPRAAANPVTQQRIEGASAREACAQVWTV